MMRPPQYTRVDTRSMPRHSAIFSSIKKEGEECVIMTHPSRQHGGFSCISFCRALSGNGKTASLSEGTPSVADNSDMSSAAIQ